MEIMDAMNRITKIKTEIEIRKIDIILNERFSLGVLWTKVRKYLRLLFDLN
jgi:hypothetical protein